MPQLWHFWNFSPKLVLCVCPREDSSRVLVKKDAFSSSSKGANDVSDARDSVHKFAVRGMQRWQHIHSPSSSGPVMPPARAAKVFSWMRSSTAAWESPGNASAAWEGTFRPRGVQSGLGLEVSQISQASFAESLPESDCFDEPDTNRWVSKSVCFFDKAMPPVLYEISVVTGSDMGAGTDSRVFCTLFSEDGFQSPELPLAVSLQNKDPFETGQLGSVIGLLHHLLSHARMQTLSDT